jgi:hypothetical protein
MKPRLQIRESYLAMIKNAVGSTQYRRLFMDVNGRGKDILENGNLSCAYFVSGILMMFGLIRAPHATVSGLVKDMEASGWKRVRTMRPGSVLIWEPLPSDTEAHQHVGFLLTQTKAVSNSTKRHHVVAHHLTFGRRNGKPTRRIQAMYRHPKLT